jgi:hypothetical protein
VVAALFAVLLLVLATTSQGAFQISRWAPLALFTLAILLGSALTRGRLAVRSRATHVALVSIWGLAGWALASMAWAQSPADALASAGMLLFYAAIVTLAFVLPLSRRAFAAAGWALAVAIGVVAIVTEVTMLTNGSSVFLAGRLNGPIDYRNATALLFAMPVWPCIIAAASSATRRLLRATALATACLCLCLVFLTQSRGILIGLSLGGVVALTLGPDRVRRVWVAVVAISLVAAASPLLLRPYHAFDGGDGAVSAHVIAVAADGALLAAAAAFLLGMAIALFDMGLRSDSTVMTGLRVGARAGVVLGVVVAVLAAAVAVGNPASFARREWNQFRDLHGEVSTSLRYTSVGGQRYDLWRVALKEFSGAPVGGVGAGNYADDYYRDRRTDRNLTDPHSFLFSLLAEEGIVGALLCASFLVALGWLIASGWRRLRGQDRRNLVAPVTVGLVMFGQSAVDWIWLIPGLTAVGLFALALGAAQAVAVDEAGEPGSPALPEVSPQQRRSAPWFARAGATAVVLVAAAAVLVLFLSNAYINRARSLIAAPRAELSAARSAATLDPWSVTPHYLESSALETLGRRPAAFAQLNDALKLEPQNFATLGVLGDFEARGGDVAAARAYYRRASALDPLDSGLRQLARYGLRARRH